MRLVGLLIVLSGGCGTTVVVCDVEPWVDQFIAGHEQQTAQCGRLWSAVADAGVTGMDYEKARQCVITRVSQGEGFTLIYDVPSANNHLIVGLAGVSSGGVLVVRQFAYAGTPQATGGDRQPKVSVVTCTKDARPEVYATAGCMVGPGKPCLTCNLPLAGQLLCGG